MAKALSTDKKLKMELGKMIKDLRKKNELSQRALAKLCLLPNTSLKYIEDGVNVPSPEPYKLLVQNLNPTISQRKKLDGVYSKIRRTPPPDICEFIIRTDGFSEILRDISDLNLTSDDMKLIKETVDKITNRQESQDETI